jgi:hypothetical protein
VVRARIPTKTETLIKNHIVNPLFDGQLSYDLDLVNNNYSYSQSLSDFLIGRIAGLQITGTVDDPVFNYRGFGPGFGPPYFYVDEVPSSYDALKNIPLSEIALIRFIPPPALMAPGGGPNGVLAVYLKKAGEGGRSLSDITQNYDHYTFHGYSITRQFYSPDYDAKNHSFSKPDTRSTLYWNPGLVVDSGNTIHFHFYNSDHAKKFRIVAEGMDRQGRLVFLDQVFGDDNKE